MSIARLRQMFEQMVVAKDPDAIARFYAPSFRMYSNGVSQGLEEFAADHRRLYATDISYAVDYDEEALVEAARSVAARIWITTRRPGEEARRIEVVLIARFDADGRIERIWETTWPDWSRLGAFEDYG